MRYILELSYAGGRYHGWQIQDNAHTVQQELNNALAKLLGEPTETIGCGRTDTGVHARYFVAHFDTGQKMPDRIVFRLNSILPSDISIKAVYAGPDDFNARFDATYRVYEYNLHQRPDPFLTHWSYYRYGELDFDKMNQACQILLKHDDFECFSKSNTGVNTFICHIMEAKWVSTGPYTHIFSIKANRFLRNMVRAIVGSLLEIGSGKMTLEQFEGVLHSKNRNEAGLSVPAHALFLDQVGYDTHTKPWKKIDG